MPNLIGQQIDKYEVLSVLGEGGMAIVYRARQTRMNRDVAIKVIEAKLARNEDFLKRFEREAQTVASLSHPHILKVFDYGQHEDTVYLVMELLRGGSLSNQIRKGGLAPEVASRILEQIADALDYAHELGIIHRDLKPQNVLLDERGNAHLTDFGIAKLLSETTALTQSGVAMGTPAYMSPEQWQGQALDARADIYALGIMLFEMLTGRLPFIADTPYSMLNMHVNVPPPLVRELRTDLPMGVEGVIQKALAKNRDQRFNSAGELAMAFKAALEGQTPDAGDYTNPVVPLNGMNSGERIPQPTPGRTDTPLSSPKRGQTRILGIGAIVVLLAVIGISFAALSGGRVGPTATITVSSTGQPTVAAPKIVALPTLTQTAREVTTISPTLSATATSIPPTATNKPTITLTSTPNPATATLTPTPVPATLTLPTATVVMIALSTLTQTPMPVTLLPTFTQTPSPTEPLNPATKAAATIAGRLTLTANAIASFTSTATPNEEETVVAIIGATDTAVAVALFTKIPTATPTRTLTLTPTNTPTATPEPTATSTPTPQPVIATVNQDGVRLRAGPSVYYNQIGTANKGDQFLVLAQEGPQDDLWYFVSLNDGKFGWIYAQFVDISPANATIQAALTQTIPAPPATIYAPQPTKAGQQPGGGGPTATKDCFIGAFWAAGGKVWWSIKGEIKSVYLYLPGGKGLSVDRDGTVAIGSYGLGKYTVEATCADGSKQIATLTVP